MRTKTFCHHCGIIIKGRLWLDTGGYAICDDCWEAGEDGFYPC